MTIYRFTHKRFANDLSGTGARLKGGRWNPKGIPVVYASENISLALLEVLVNAGALDDLQMLQLMRLDIPDTTHKHIIRTSGLKKAWHSDIDYTQWMGQEILANKSVLYIQCPSAVVHQEHNYLLNPQHPDFARIKLTTATDFVFDERLFKTNPVS